MEVEIKSPTEIELIPQNCLEDSIIRSGKWLAKIQEPEPLEINKVRIVLTKEN